MLEAAHAQDHVHVDGVAAIDDTAKMASALSRLTPERWEKARAVLSGEDNTGVSFLHAARAAGVKRRTLARWIERSRERRPEDERWIWTIAEVVDAAPKMQADRLEDVLWSRAMAGWDEPVFHGGKLVGYKHKHDNRALIRLLQVRDPAYRNPAPQATALSMGDGEVYQRLRAQLRLDEIDVGERGRTSGERLAHGSEAGAAIVYRRLREKRPVADRERQETGRTDGHFTGSRAGMDSEGVHPPMNGSPVPVG